MNLFLKGGTIFMKIGNEIKKIRIDQGITQVELAQRASVAQGRVSMIENDKYPDMSSESLRPLLEVLNVSYAEVCARAQATDDDHHILYDIMEKINQISKAVAPGNGIVVESAPKVVDELGNTLFLPIEFSPILTVMLKENIGEFSPGDVLFFSKIKQQSEIKESDYLVEETISGTPHVFLATDTEKHEKAIGRAIKALKQL